MHTERLERMAPATFFLAACVGFFGVYAAAEYAHAQAIPPTRAQGTNRPLLRRSHGWIASRQCQHPSSIHRVRTRCQARDPRFAGKPGVDIWHKSERRA
jgi:hypothetical protein